MKKEARFGIHEMSVSISNHLTGSPARQTAVSIYALGKITFYVTARTFHRILHNRTNESHYTKSIPQQAFRERRIKVTMPVINSGFDYYVNERNSLSFQFQLQTYTSEC